MLGTPSFTAKAMLIGERVQNFRCSQPEGSGSSGKRCPKSITVTTGPPSGFQNLAPPAEEVPADQADGSEEREPSNQDVSRSEGHRCLYSCALAACTPPP